MPLPPACQAAVLELHARYAHAFDDGDDDALIGCFTPDGVMRTTRPLELVGHDALRAFARERRAADPAPARHASWHHLLTPDGPDAASGRCTAAVLRTAAAGVEVLFTAVYRDRFVRGPDGTWRIALREVALDRAAAVVSH